MARRKPLNRNVREGLRRLSALVEAGGSADVMGYDEEAMTAEDRAAWDQVLKAVDWINSLPPG